MFQAIGPAFAQQEEPDFLYPSQSETAEQFNLKLPLPVTGHSDPAMVALDAAISGFMSEKKITGAAVAVTRSGRLVYARGFGYADLENSETVQPDALFRVAGVSKAITQATILQLVQRGHLGLNDKVFQLLRYKPLLPRGKEIDTRIYDITIAQLLDHRSGWDRKLENRDPMFEAETIATAFGVHPPPTTEQVIAHQMGHALNHEPGTVRAYSNFGYCLLGRVIEEITRQPYETYVQQNLLEKIGITDMRIAHSQIGGRAANEVKYYSATDLKSPSIFPSERGKLVPAQYGAWSLETMDADNGWLASAIDLVRFASAFEYQENFAALKGEVMRSCFHAGYTQTGRLPGAASILVISRKFHDTCWAILLNTDSVSASEFNLRFIDALKTITSWPEYDLFPNFLKSFKKFQPQ